MTDKIEWPTPPKLETLKLHSKSEDSNKLKKFFDECKQLVDNWVADKVYPNAAIVVFLDEEPDAEWYTTVRTNIEPMKALGLMYSAMKQLEEETRVRNG